SFDPADEALVQKILTLMSNRRFNFEVRTAQEHEAQPFSDKIQGLIDWADVTFGIFTKKFTAESGRVLPPPYIISECSFALGRYRDHHRKTVHGIVENPIKHENIGLNVAKGDEYPVFDREDVLNNDTSALEGYFRDLHSRHLERANRRPKYC